MLCVYRKGTGSTHTTAQDHIYPVTQKPWLGSLCRLCKTFSGELPFYKPREISCPPQRPATKVISSLPAGFPITQFAPCTGPNEATSEPCLGDGPDGNTSRSCLRRGLENCSIVSSLGFIGREKLVGSRGYSGEEEKMMTPRRNAALGQGSAHAPSLLLSGTCSPHAFTPGYRPPPPLPNSPIVSVLTLFRRPPGCPTRVLPVCSRGDAGRRLRLV